MKLEIYSVFDTGTGSYGPPLFVRARGEAMRSFMDACSQADSNFSKHASYYTLFFLGHFDDNAGLFATGSPERVISALECLSQPG